MKRLTSEITEGKRAESTTRDEVLYLRDERDKLNEKCRALQAEKDLSSVRSENAIRDLEALRMTNSSAQSSCNEYEQRLLTLQQELLAAKQLTATEQRGAADRLDAAERQAARIVDLGSYLLLVVVVVRGRCDFLFTSRSAVIACSINRVHTTSQKWCSTLLRPFIVVAFQSMTEVVSL